MEEFLIVMLTLSFDWVKTCLKPTPPPVPIVLFYGI